MIRRIALSALGAAVLMGLSALPASAGTVSASSGGLKASFHAGTHHPKANHVWGVSVSATLNGRAVRGATAWYQFIYNGQQVSKQAVCLSGRPGCNGRHAPETWFHFNGGYRDKIIWPTRSVGFPLTIRAVISAGGHTVYLPYSVQVIK